MNLENMRKLRTRMRSRKNPVKFDMDKWFTHNEMGLLPPEELLEVVEDHPCGTVACLSGQVAIMSLQEGNKIEDPHGNWLFREAKRYLGLTEHEADSLFYGHWWKHYYRKSLSLISKAEAIRELTRLIEKEEASQ